MCWRLLLDSDNGTPPQTSQEEEVNFSTYAFSLFCFLSGSLRGVSAGGDPGGGRRTWIHHQRRTRWGSRSGGRVERLSIDDGHKVRHVSSSQVPDTSEPLDETHNAPRLAQILWWSISWCQDGANYGELLFEAQSGQVDVRWLRRKHWCCRVLCSSNSFQETFSK